MYSAIFFFLSLIFEPLCLFLHPYAHIKGEGIGSIPVLYGHALTANEERLAQEDYSRTEICALFFIKRGFPYVSIIEGGFAAAHSFLFREKLFQLNQVLVDYDENVSIWAKLEKSHENPVGGISKHISALIKSGRKQINKATNRVVDRGHVFNRAFNRSVRPSQTNDRPVRTQFAIIPFPSSLPKYKSSW